MNGSLVRDRPGEKFVGSDARVLAILDDLNDGFLSDELAAFRVVNFAVHEEHHGVDFTGVDVQRAGLPPLIEHLMIPAKSKCARFPLSEVSAAESISVAWNPCRELRKNARTCAAMSAGL